MNRLQYLPAPTGFARASWAVLIILCFIPAVARGTEPGTGITAQHSDSIPPNELTEIVEKMNSQNAFVRKATIDSLASRGLEGRSALQALMQALNDSDLGVRGRAARVISKLGQDVFPILLEALQDPSSKLRQGLIASIAVLEVPVSEKLPVLLKALEDGDSGVRMQAAWGIGRLGPEAQEAIPLLAQMTRNDETQVRIRTIQALSHIGWKVKDAVPPLGLALADPDEDVKAQAAHAISVIGPNAVVVLPAIEAALQDPNPRIQRDLIEALDTLGPEARSAVPALLATFRSPRFGIRAAVIKALTRIEGTPVPSLWKAAQGDDPVLRKYALYHLDLLGEFYKKGSPTEGMILSAVIGTLPPDPDQTGDTSSQNGQSPAAILSPGERKDLCRHIQRLKERAQLEFEYPNFDGPDGFLAWTTWKWPSGQGVESEFFGTEVDIDNDGMQELLIKWWSWGPHMYRRVEYIFVLNGKDLSPYFMSFENIDEATIASTPDGVNPVRYNKSSISHISSGIQDTVSEYARINPFTFKNVHYILVDEGDLIVGRYRTGGRLEVVCNLSASKTSKKKRS